VVNQDTQVFLAWARCNFDSSTPTFFPLLIRTALVLCAAKASPLESRHALARFPALLQILSATGRCLATTTIATYVVREANRTRTFRIRGPKDPIVHGYSQQWAVC